MEKLKVIFHVDEMENWRITINNVKNFVHGDIEYDVKVLANGVAVKGYIVDTEYVQEYKIGMNGLMDMGVKFLACNNAIKMNEIDIDNINPRVKIVPTGVIELVRSQDEGYRYIKP